MQTQTFNIALPKALVQKIDAVAKKEYRNRSELIREAVRVYLERRLEWDELFAYGRTMGKTLGIKNEEDVNNIVWDYRHGKNQ